jgi:drug/metabolite transporter (DMT)-like permease
MYFTSFSSETYTGLSFCLGFSTNYAIIIIINRNLQKLKSEVISFFLGMFLALFGGFLMIVNGEDISNITFKIWGFLLILGFLNYHIVYFQFKTLVLKVVSQLIPIKFISVYFSFFLSFFLLREKISILEFVLSVVIFVTMCFYSRRMRELKMMNKNGSAQVHLTPQFDNKE